MQDLKWLVQRHKVSFYCLSSDHFISTKVQRSLKISQFSLCLICELFFDCKKKSHYNTFLFVGCLICQHQGIPEGERCFSAAIKKTGKSVDLGNLSWGSLSTVGMVRIRITNLCLLGSGAETRIMRCLSNEVPSTDM